MRRNSAESERVLPSFTLEENVNEKENQSLSSPSRHWMAPLQIKLLRISSLFFFCPSTGHFCRWAWQLQSQIDSPSFFLDGCVCFIIQWFFLWIFFVALLCFALCVWVRVCPIDSKTETAKEALPWWCAARRLLRWGADRECGRPITRAPHCNEIGRPDDKTFFFSFGDGLTHTKKMSIFFFFSFFLIRFLEGSSRVLQGVYRRYGGCSSLQKKSLISLAVIEFYRVLPSLISSVIS